VKRSVVPAAVLAALLVLVPSAYAVRDFARTALNIIPSGQYGGVPVPPKADRQARMYDALTPEFDRVSRNLFKQCFVQSDVFGRRIAGQIEQLHGS
jgi:hypothetical protein